MASTASVGVRTQSPSYQAYQILHIAFVVAPLFAGIDEFEFGFLSQLGPSISHPS